MRYRIFRLALLTGLIATALAGQADVPQTQAGEKPRSTGSVLRADAFQHHIDKFNKNDQELYPQYIPNANAWSFLRTNAPLLECPDPEIEETYYFRWWTYRKHVKRTSDGFVITEFLPPVGWAGKHNTISCAAGHHLREGRWLADPQYLNDYSAFWFRKGGNVRGYSFWAAESLWARYLVTGDSGLMKELLPDLIKNWEAWAKEKRDANGLFWQEDGADGMEVSISGSGYRATINSYMYGDAVAIAQIAELAGQKDVAARFQARAAELKRLVEERLWDPEARFYKVRARGENTPLSNARELHGLTPWYFNLPGADRSVAWKQLVDPQGFQAPFGPTTAEQRHPRFAVSYQGHECQWNGPSWPYATTITLVGLANLLNHYDQDVLGSKDYFNLLKTYTRSHRLTLDDGRVVPWIDENLNPANGDWLARTRLKSWKNGTWDPGKGGVERGKDYNHSGYCDLVISGLIGLRPRPDDTVEVNPLAPESWDYFCLDQVPYHGRILTILFDKTGERYQRGKGLRIFADGREIASSERVARLKAPLPAKARAVSNSSTTPSDTRTETSSSEDWPQFRGPTGDGQLGKASLPLEWSENSHIAWKSAVTGRGRSSPVIVGNRICLTTAVEQGVRRTRIGPDDMQVAEHVSLRVVCLDKATGKSLWETKLWEVDKPAAVHWLNSWSTPTPVMEAGRVYCDFGTFGTACLDTETGKIVWQKQIPLDHQVGPGSSVVVYRDLMILVRDGRDAQYITALDKNTGKEVWKTERPPIKAPDVSLKKSFSTPILITEGGQAQMVAPCAHWAVSYDPATGKELWRVRHGDGFSIGTRPVAGHGLVYVGTGCFKPMLWVMRTDGQGDVTATHVVWKTSKQFPVMSSPILIGEEIYWVSDDGMANCADAQTGQVHWQERLGGGCLASPIGNSERLYFFRQDGRTVVLKPGHQFQKLAENPLEGTLIATPAASGKSLYIRTDSHLYRIQE